MNPKIQQNERIIIEQIRKAKSVVIEIDGARIRVGGTAPHDIALAVQKACTETMKRIRREQASRLMSQL